MRHRLFLISLILTVFTLFLAGLDSLERRSYQLAVLYLLCVALYIATWRISLRVTIQRDQWIILIGSATMFLAFLDYWQQGKKYLHFVYLGAAIVNLLPLLIIRKKASS